MRSKNSILHISGGKIMNDKKYEVLKVTKRNNSTQYLIEIKREDINKDFLENLRLEIEAGVYDDYEIEEM